MVGWLLPAGTGQAFLPNVTGADARLEVDKILTIMQQSRHGLPERPLVNEDWHLLGSGYENDGITYSNRSSTVTSPPFHHLPGRGGSCSPG